MCGRYTLTNPKLLSRRFSTENDLELSPVYNASPGMVMPVIVKGSQNKLQLMRWGLIPSWADDPRIGFKMINARAESVSKLPSFRSSFKNQRCLVPSSGFFEWKKDARNRVPYFITSKAKEIFAFAGLYNIWKDKSDRITASYTIITCNSSKQMSSIHDRMPVIIPKEIEGLWLDTNTTSEDLLPFLVPYKAELEIREISKLVNNVRNNSEEIINPI